MEQEMFNITSQKYTDYLREMLLDMKNSTFLSDVTLVCEDKKQYKAHKFILSSSSPFFKDIICDNLLANPIIYLRGIHSYEMELILEFIYLGQATCKEDQVKEFLDVATSLEIKVFYSFLAQFALLRTKMQFILQNDFVQAAPNHFGNTQKDNPVC